MSVIGGFTIFHQMQVSNDLTLLALQDELTRIAVSSLRSKLDEGTFLQTRVKDRLLYVKTAEISNQQAVYRASAINFPGELVARLGARSGLVRWTTRNQDSLRFALVSGKLIAVEDGSWVFRTEGRDLQLKAESRVLGLQPVPGGCLVVAYNPMDRTVERALPFDACPDEIINANKAEDSTKSNRRQQR